MIVLALLIFSRVGYDEWLTDLDLELLFKSLVGFAFS
jgi:hypothetical protein